MAVICKTNKKIDDSIAFICLIAYGFFIATAKEISFLWLIPLLLQILILRINFFKILKKLIKINLFIIISVLILVFEKNYDLAILIFLRANLILLFTLSFEFDGFRIYSALNNLKVANKFCLILFFTVKYIEILFSNTQRLKEVLLLRGFNPKFNINTFKIYADIFAHLLYISVNKIQKMEDLITLRTINHKLVPSRKIIIKRDELIFLGSITGVIFVYYFI